MTDRLVKVLENGRLVCRGIRKRGAGAFVRMSENETLPFTVDWSDWLGSDTIASVTNETSGPAVSSASNTTTIASLTISGARDGWIEHRITTAAGAVKELLITVNADNPTREYPRFV